MDYTYDGGLLQKLKRSASRNGINLSQTYQINSDVFGNMTSLQVGNRTLASYEYNGDFLLTRLNYGNGQAVNYTYDELERLKTVAYPDGRTVTYRYTGDGNLHSTEESGGDSEVSRTYQYDSYGRMVSL